MSAEAISEYVKTYGPFAFGVGTLLLIWTMIVQPEMSRRVIDYQAHRELLTQQKEIVSAQREITQSQAVTAKLMERLVDKLSGQIGEQ